MFLFMMFLMLVDDVHVAGGLKELSPRFSIRVTDERGRLPMSHTCFNLIDLPICSSKEELASKLTIAIRNAASNQFGFA